MSAEPQAKKDRFADTAEDTAAAERDIQQEIDRKEKARPKPKEADKGAMQAGARRYPEPPFPKQHLGKPGEEFQLDPAPMYDAPHYQGSGKLDGKVALITGGDSGIGRAVAILFAREGADIAIAYLNEHADAEATSKAVEQEGRRCIAISGDVADPEFCKEVVARTRQQLGRLDVLVNNAAFQEHAEDFEDLTETHFDRTLKTNLYGYFHMAKAAVPHMKPGSAIVMTGSVTGLLGSKNLLDYAMTKGGIHAFVRSLAGQLIDPRQRRGTGAGVDSAQPRRSRSRRRIEVRQPGRDETPGAAGRDRARLRVSGLAQLLQLHHRRDSAGCRRLLSWTTEEVASSREPGFRRSLWAAHPQGPPCPCMFW